MGSSDERRGENQDRDLIERIAARRGDAAFMDRLRRRMAEDGTILDRLADRHQHRYPKPNTAGFPVNQCLDCGEWIIAEPDDPPILLCNCPPGPCLGWADGPMRCRATGGQSGRAVGDA
jgi:hypothetical protein